MDTRMSFHQSLEDLQKELLSMGSDVERQLHNAVESLQNLDESQARAVVDFDDKIDEAMLRIEERCLRLIALQQPMASDLRLIGMTLKVAIDLERIADHAVDIAKITIRLFGQQLVKPLVDIPRMTEIAREMLRGCLTAFAEKDIHKAAELAKKDDEVDKIYSTVMTEIVSLMGSDFTTNKQLTHLLMVAHYIERIADHTTNIGEGLIYLVTGKRKDLNV
ncbi:phosphate signaling complex protein PhoU [Paenibacillus turpanensis]|uniref:phosphate signaling complex protein PhoU n=1 Tax=Paenibacillus turpanensis TaxID=2689078 RepID=UPI0014073D94|nr:phosphate signaling complex protein PhoU [Paenibacillus turpanensis]